jgi:hypothetical protein
MDGGSIRLLKLGASEGQLPGGRSGDEAFHQSFLDEGDAEAWLGRYFHLHINFAASSRSINVFFTPLKAGFLT